MKANALDPFWALIDKALSSRKTSKDAMSWNAEHKAPRYVVTMCEELMAELNRAGAAVTLAEMILLEKTCTGADYHHKLALRCHCLAVPAAA